MTTEEDRKYHRKWEADYYKKNPDKRKEKSRRHYLNKKAKIIERNRLWASKNPEKVKANRARFYQKNRARICATMKARRDANLEKARVRERASHKARLTPNSQVADAVDRKKRVVIQFLTTELKGTES